VKDKIRDAANFAQKLTIKKVVNGLKLLGSYCLTRVTGQPAIYGLPISIAIEPTTHCNLRCPQCPSGLRSFTRPTGMIDKTTFQKIIDELSGTLSYLTFYFQGEPYLHPEFLNMVAHAEKNGIYTATSTNAHYLDKKKAEETVKAGLSRLIISVDGLDQKSYEKYRIGGSLEKVKNGISNLVQAKKKLKSNTPYIIIQYLVMKHNEQDSKKVKAFAAELGANEAKLKTVQIYDYENGSELMPEMATNTRYYQGEDGRYRIKNKFYNHCWKMWHSSVITWNGGVVPCCFDKDAKHVFGNVTDTPFSKIWTNNIYYNFRNMLFNSRKSIDICQNCTEGTNVWI
jgi:radical SAM protein with 4Fe4S-binding SPASM domain